MPRLFFTYLMLCLLTIGTNTNAQIIEKDHPNWVKPYKPFRVAGNVYYVGTDDLSCYLITTPNGHILINQAVEQTVGQLQKNVEALGFKFSDIKILLTNQAHFDHVGGLAKIKQLTGAQVMINEGDVQVVEDGGNSDYLYGGKGVGSLFTPVKVDRILHDHDTIELGGTKLEMLHHPGHTKGSCSYLLTTKDEHHSYRVLIANIPRMLSEVTLPGMPTYPNAGKDFLYTYSAMRQLKFDVWVAAHSSQFYLHKVHKQTDRYNPASFGNIKAYQKELDEMEVIYKDKLKEKKKQK